MIIVFPVVQQPKLGHMSRTQDGTASASASCNFFLGAVELAFLTQLANIMDIAVLQYEDIHGNKIWAKLCTYVCIYIYVYIIVHMAKI